MVRNIKKNSPLTSKFHATVAQSTRFRAEAPPPGGGQGGARGGYRRGSRSQHRDLQEEHAMRYPEAHRLVARNPSQAADRLAVAEARIARYMPPGTPYPEEPDKLPRVSRQDVELSDRARREKTWQTDRNVYRTTSKDKKSASRFINEEVKKAAPSHAQWIEQQMKDPSSIFNMNLDVHGRKTGRYTSGQRKALELYTDALQRGESHQSALDLVRRSKLRETVGRPTERARATRSNQARAVMARPKPSGRETKFQSSIPSVNAKEFKFGIAANAPPNMDRLKKFYPNQSERNLIQIQQSARENITQELLANQKWAHETRKANLLGQKTGRLKEDPDKVTIFTTNAGHPAVSVPTDSLVGQYIIRKRKAILGNVGVAPTQLRGRFPNAVRDQHIVDLATGTSFGVQGRQGLYTNTGYRWGKKQSSGYGKPRPLGGSILYDSAGRPLYDAQGNIRYTEGATRPIDWATPSLGFRVLMG